jgi:hypothetical protein
VVGTENAIKSAQNRSIITVNVKGEVYKGAYPSKNNCRYERKISQNSDKVYVIWQSRNWLKK